jgi:solute carrier family 31 (copper transporter), member 1
VGSSNLFQSFVVDTKEIDGMSSMSMSMSMSMAAESVTATMSGMAMPTASDGSMSISSDSSSMMGMDSMAMVFFTSSNTPLYSYTWTPNTDGRYAGTCIFLIAFAAIFRVLVAIRVRFHEIMSAVRQHYRAGMQYSPPSETKPRARPWRASEAITLAAMDVVLAGVSYLL